MFALGHDSRNGRKIYLRFKIGAFTTDAEEVATEMGVSFSLDSLMDKTVGGKFCWGAANFRDTVVPSEAALHHRAIRVSLIYEFVVKYDCAMYRVSVPVGPARMTPVIGEMGAVGGVIRI